MSPPAASRRRAASRARRRTIDFRPTRFVAVDGFIDTKLRLLAVLRVAVGIRDYMEPDFVLATARYWSRFGDGQYAEPLEMIRDAAMLSARRGATQVPSQHVDRPVAIEGARSATRGSS